MNDFTPDELEEILGWATVYCIGASDLSYRVSKALIDKIQFMINNYDAKVIEVWHCEKCGHLQ